MGRKGTGVEARDTSIRVHFTVPGQGRERHTLMLDGAPLPPTPTNIRHATRLVDEIRSRIRMGTYKASDYFGSQAGHGGATTVDQQIEHWLGSIRVADSTRAGYEAARRFWRMSLDQAVADLRTSHIQRALAARPDLSGKTANNYVSVLREALDLAVTDGILQVNPAARVPRAPHQKDPPDPFTGAEADAIVAWMRDNAPAQVHNLVELWMWTGMRTSEVFALRWPAVDLQAQTATVHEAMVRGKLKTSTKTSTARLVRLNSRAAAALERQRQHTQLASLQVFHDPRYDTPWVDERAFRRSFWTPCLKALGIRYRRPYTMRHTYATRMLEAKMKPAFCALQLGHSVEMFLTTYARWIDGDRDAAEMRLLEEAMVAGRPAIVPGSSL